MSSVLFIVTIPTENEEQNIEQKVEKSNESNCDEKNDCEIYENGAFKFVRFQ